VRQPLWIEERDVLAIHARMLALHGGASGLRDVGLLLSALVRPQHHFAYAKSLNTIALAAIYTAGLVRNYPFVDGNKRTGFVIGLLFLEMNGYSFTASEEAAAQAVMALAAGDLNEDGFEQFLRANATRTRK
jgi:death-on-curing protein